jgi:hypothetical protein
LPDQNGNKQFLQCALFQLIGGEIKPPFAGLSLPKFSLTLPKALLNLVLLLQDESFRMNPKELLMEGLMIGALRNMLVCSHDSTLLTQYELCQKEKKIFSLTSPPFVPLQGESLQGEPLSLFKERGKGGEVFRMLTT